ncbi:MAG: hypothetical protein A3E37_05740 [Candidatus Andersenbacteria bacterium RIFCSPHIGHO2_12_FULL_46_9]|nr:MAG: hypothetical protein A3E37_05740 [Candidatus Andersenbacteria bacterium RIFCSPHIGHO2_12_FULL_46_9]
MDIEGRTVVHAGAGYFDVAAMLADDLFSNIEAKASPLFAVLGGATDAGEFSEKLGHFIGSHAAAGVVLVYIPTKRESLTTDYNIEIMLSW